MRVMVSYNQAADGVVLLKSFSKIFCHTLARLSAFAGVRKREFFLTCKPEAFN